MELWKIQYYNSVFLLLPIFICSASAQITLPSKQDGFWYENRIAKEESILIEAFFDPVCPDSRDSWPPLKLALQHYGSRVSLVVHPFPLPYHDNAFISSRALHIIDKLNTSATYKLLESFFDQQDKFYGKATFNLSKASVVDEIAKFTSNAIGNSNYAAVKAGLTDPKTDQATRISFKYGCVKARLQLMVEELDAAKAKRISEIEVDLNNQQTAILQAARNDIDNLNKKAAQLKIGVLEAAEAKVATAARNITDSAHLDKTATIHQATGTTTIKTEVSGAAETTAAGGSTATTTATSHAAAGGAKQVTAETKTVETTKHQSNTRK